MTNVIDQTILWLKDFKSHWLPQHASTDVRLVELITAKLLELERLLLGKIDEDEVYIDDHHEQSNEPTDGTCAPQSSSEHSLPTPPDDKSEPLSRPAILLKRISLADAEHYLPLAWKATKSKRRRKSRKRVTTITRSYEKRTTRNTRTNKALLIEDQIMLIPVKSTRPRRTPKSKDQLQHFSTSSITSTQSKADAKTKGKRKLRALDAEDDDLYTLGNLPALHALTDLNDCEQISRFIGQNGILSQTRKINDTVDHDCRMVGDPQQALSKYAKASDELEPLSTPTPSPETLPVVTNGSHLEEDEALENNGHGSTSFAFLNNVSDKPLGTASVVNNKSTIDYADCIEDISNDGMDPQAMPTSDIPVDSSQR